jgi:hypothetical protein
VAGFSSDRTWFLQLFRPGQPCCAGEQCRGERGGVRLLALLPSFDTRAQESVGFPNPVTMAAPPSPSSRSPSSEVAVHRFSGTLDVSSSPSRYVRDVNPSLWSSFLLMAAPVSTPRLRGEREAAKVRNCGNQN